MYFCCKSCNSWFQVPNSTVVNFIIRIILIVVPVAILFQLSMDALGEILVNENTYQQLGIPYTKENILYLLGGFLLSFYLLSYLGLAWITHKSPFWIKKLLVEVPTIFIMQLSPLPPPQKHHLIKDIVRMSWKERTILLTFTLSVIGALTWLTNTLSNN